MRRSAEPPLRVAFGKMVFIPHGMDQMFWQPQRSLFPNLQGVVAQAVLNTGEGRKQYRQRCVTLFTNLFLRLTNRVDELQQRLRPVVAQLGANAIAQHEKAVADLKQRIAERVEHLRKELLVPDLKPIALNRGQESELTNWISTVEQGKAVYSQISTNGRDIPQLRAGSDDKPALAMWEMRVLLPAGVYRVSVGVGVDEPIFRGPNCPVALNVWGGTEMESETSRADPRHVDLIRSFQIASERPEEAVIQCQVQSIDQPLTFQLSRAVMVRVE